MNQMGAVMKDACGPCLSEKQIKKQKEQDAKDLKATINYLARNNGYDEKVSIVIGGLLTRLIHLQGPLK
jgi:hypothetical protein